MTQKKESLGSKQERFSRDLGQLLLFAHLSGIGVRMGETWRTPEQAKWNAEQGKGIEHSLHCDRLAADLICAIDGEVVWDGDPYTQLADHWKGMGDDHCWGGDFTRPDVYHFSITHGGRK